MVAVMIFTLLLVALGVLAARFGVDTRDGRDWQPYDVMEPRTPRW